MVNEEKNKRKIRLVLEWIHSLYYSFNHNYNPIIYNDYELTKEIIKLGNKNIALIH